jgi:FlaA1/EpsC-like NDP-sugar epimerase
MEQYANAAYFGLKIPYFISLDYDPERPLVLWGAGKKGKSVARLLLAQHIDFIWLCNNPAKIGLSIYEVPIFEEAKVESLIHPQILILVSNPEHQQKIRLYLMGLGLRGGLSFYFLV